MADSEFWRNLGEKFRALPQERWALTARWLVSSENPPGPRQWILMGSPDGLRMRFEVLARQGGDALAPNDIVDSLYAWFERLYAENLNPGSPIYQDRRNEAGVHYPYQCGGSIYQVADASDALCLMLETREFEAERTKRALEAQQNDPRNWSALRQHIEATQAIKVVMTSTPFEIAEDSVREAVARHDGIKPEEVTWQRIRSEVANLLPRYPHIRLIPSGTATQDHPSATIQPGPTPTTAVEQLTIGEQIERLRIEADISQEKLAELVNLDVRTVQRHLSGETKPSKRLIYRYEKAFGKLLKREIVISKLP